jgi:hypothetical protein
MPTIQARKVPLPAAVALPAGPASKADPCTDASSKAAPRTDASVTVQISSEAQAAMLSEVMDKVMLSGVPRTIRRPYLTPLSSS